MHPSRDGWIHEWCHLEDNKTSITKNWSWYNYIVIIDVPGKKPYCSDSSFLSFSSCMFIISNNNNNKLSLEPKDRRYQIVYDEDRKCPHDSILLEIFVHK